MSLFDTFKKIVAESNDSENNKQLNTEVTDDSEKETTIDPETGEFVTETGEFATDDEDLKPEYKEFIIQRLQKLKKVILKDIDSATIIINYIKSSNTESEAIKNCEALYYTLKDIKSKLQDQGADLANTDIIDTVDSLCEYIMVPENNNSRNLVINPKFVSNPDTNVQSLLDNPDIKKKFNSKQVDLLNIKDLLSDFIVLKAFLESKNVVENVGLVETLKDNERKGELELLRKKEYNLNQELNKIREKEIPLNQELSELVRREQDLPETSKGVYYSIRKKIIKEKNELIIKLKEVTRNKESLNNELQNIQDLITQKSGDHRSHIYNLEDKVIENPNYSDPSGYDLILNLYMKLKRIITNLIKGSNDVDTIKVQQDLVDLKRRLYSFIDNLSNYYKDINGNTLISKNDFLRFKEDYISKSSEEVEKFLNDISKSIKQNDQQFVINTDFINDILTKLVELKLKVQAFFIFSEKDDTSDMIRSNYNDLLNTISTKDFIFVYKQSYSAKDNPAVRQFLSTLLCKIFNLSESMCKDSIYFIEDNFKNYISDKPFSTVQKLPEDYNDTYLRLIMNLGVLRIALVDTANFIQYSDINDISDKLNTYSERLVTRKDAREDIVKPLNELYKGILNLINPALLCKTNIETIQTKDIQEIVNKSLTDFNTKEAINFLEKLKKFIEEQLFIIESIPDVSESKSFIEDSDVIYINDIIVNLRNAFDNEFKKVYQTVFINYKIDLENKKRS